MPLVAIELEDATNEQLLREIQQRLDYDDSVRVPVYPSYECSGSWLYIRNRGQLETYSLNLNYCEQLTEYLNASCRKVYIERNFAFCLRSTLQLTKYNAEGSLEEISTHQFYSVSDCMTEMRRLNQRSCGS